MPDGLGVDTGLAEKLFQRLMGNQEDLDLKDCLCVVGRRA